MKEAQLVITIKKLDGCLNMQINGTHGVNWPKYFEKAYQGIKSALQDQFEKDAEEEPDAESVIKHLAGLSKKSITELKEEFDKIEGNEVEKITKLTIKYLKESLEKTLKD